MLTESIVVLTLVIYENDVVYTSCPLDNLDNFFFTVLMIKIFIINPIFLITFILKKEINGSIIIINHRYFLKNILSLKVLVISIRK